jgi:membrane protease YdiL (CAAX protease family)
MIDNTIEQPEQIIEEKRPVWGFWATVGFGFVIAIAATIVQSIITFAFIAAKLVSSPGTFTYEIIRETAMNGLAISIATIASSLVCIGLVLVFIRIRKNAKVPQYLGLKKPSWKIVLLLLGISIAFIVLISVAGTLLHIPDVPDFQVDLYKTSVWPPLLWIAVVVFAPAFEEVLFRGFLFKGFRQARTGIIGAILITSIIWSLLHVQYDPFHMASIFVLGLLYGTVRYKTGSLWSTFIMHAFNNCAAMVSTLLYLQGM